VGEREIVVTLTFITRVVFTGYIYTSLCVGATFQNNPRQTETTQSELLFSIAKYINTEDRLLGYENTSF